MQFLKNLSKYLKISDFLLRPLERPVKRTLPPCRQHIGRFLLGLLLLSGRRLGKGLTNHRRQLLYRRNRPAFPAGFPRRKNPNHAGLRPFHPYGFRLDGSSVPLNQRYSGCLPASFKRGKQRIFILGRSQNRRLLTQTHHLAAAGNNPRKNKPPILIFGVGNIGYTRNPQFFGNLRRNLRRIPIHGLHPRHNIVIFGMLQQVGFNFANGIGQRIGGSRRIRPPKRPVRKQNCRIGTTGQTIPQHLRRHRRPHRQGNNARRCIARQNRHPAGKSKGLGIQFIDNTRQAGADQVACIRIKRIVRNLRNIRHLFD